MKEKVGKRIKSLREQKGLSQEELADNLNISRSAYERMENGKSNSWATHLEQLSTFFEVEPEYFLQNDDKNVQHIENFNGGLAFQNSKIKTLNALSEKLIEQYDARCEQYEARLKEKDEIILLLKTQGK